MGVEQLGGWDDDGWGIDPRAAERMGAPLFGQKEDFGDARLARGLVMGIAGPPPPGRLH